MIFGLIAAAPATAGEICTVSAANASGSCAGRAECAQSRDCATAVVLGVGSSSCGVRCRDEGGGDSGSLAGWTGRLPPLTPQPLRLGDLLNQVRKESGLPIRAPRFNEESHVTLRLAELPTADWIAGAARQLGAVAVSHASGLAVELIPVAEIDGRSFPEGSGEPLPVARFHHQDIVTALHMIARGGRVDLVVPEGLSGDVDGDYSGLGWKAAMEAVLRYSGNPRPVQVAANGLVQVVP